MLDYCVLFIYLMVLSFKISDQSQNFILKIYNILQIINFKLFNFIILISILKVYLFIFSVYLKCYLTHVVFLEDLEVNVFIFYIFINFNFITFYNFTFMTDFNSTIICDVSPFTILKLLLQSIQDL